MNQKTIGMIIIAFSVVLFGAVLMESISLQEANKLIHEDCGLPEGICPANAVLPYESLMAFTIDGFLFAFGAFIFFEKKEKAIKAKPAPSDLDEEEKKVYEMIGEKGALFQSDIVESTSIGKVKVTRILDKLEAKQLIERQRRGMTNLVKLKNE